jgi:phage baseplate assembly protein W
MQSASDFAGRGWAFPLRLDSAGSFVLSGGEREIEEAIRLILGTSFGERPQRPEYGCGIHDMVFDTVDAGLSGKVAAAVRASLIRWEPRIDVTDVSAAPLPDQPHVLGIWIGYRVKATNDRRNLVFPFYSIPEE